MLQLEVCYLNLSKEAFKSYCHRGSEDKQQLTQYHHSAE